jgi:hypothetical protein
MSHNACGYGEDMNPDHIDGLTEMRDGWAMNNAVKAMRAQAIVNGLDPSRIVYHHSSGNLGTMHTVNFYPNWVPIQELDDWFEHWATVGVKPCFLVEYGAPFGWDWTMYRGWYNGAREFGSATVPWEYCIAEWNAQLLGDQAYNLSDRQKADLRWEAKQFHDGRLWYRWDYPTAVGDERLDELQPLQAAYTESNWRAFRGWGLSANSPWEFGRFWQPRDGFKPKRRELPTDWDHLQSPGFSPDFIDRTYARMDIAYERSDWQETPTSEALRRNNRPLLAFIAGPAAHFTAKDHIYQPGEMVEKQLIIINNSRRAVTCEGHWTPPTLAHGNGATVATDIGGTFKVTVAAGEQARLPLRCGFDAGCPPGTYGVSAYFQFSTGEIQNDDLKLHVLAPAAPPALTAKIALFDPTGETAKLLTSLKVAATPVAADADLAAYDLLVIGKGALTVDGPAPDLRRVREGLKVICFEQTAAALEKRLGLRTAEYGLRQVFERVPDHPALAGLSAADLRDWRGAATLLPPRLSYELSPRFSGMPTVRWCGLEETRLWRCGCQGSVASVLVEKPPRGDWLALLDGGYSLQYSPLLAYREGRGLLLLCQMDVTGRSEPEPAAAILTANLLKYAAAWQPAPRRGAVYAGEAAGAAWLKDAGVEAQPYDGGKLGADQVLVAAPGAGERLAGHKPELAAWLGAGGHLLTLGLDQTEANRFLPTPITTKAAEHIACTFDPPSADSPLAGLGPADVHNRAPRQLPLITSGAQTVGDGVLASAGHVVFCQMPAFEVCAGGGELHSVSVSPDEADAKRLTALVSEGTAAFTQFGRKINAGAPGHTYTFRAWVKPLGAPASLRLEIERAGRPWDRAAKGPDTVVPPDAWTELHLTFKVDKPFAEGWQAYVYCGTLGTRYRVDRLALYEGPYAAGGGAAADGGTPDLFAGSGFEGGLNGWYLTAAPDQFNLRRTWRKSSVTLARLLGNLGVAGATPLLERFGQPVGGVGGPSLVRNGDFGQAGNPAAEWEFGGPAGAKATRVPQPDGGWALRLEDPNPQRGKPDQFMLAQHEIATVKGQWYRLSWRARRDGAQPAAVSWTIQNTANWHALFDYETFKPTAEWQTFSYLLPAADTAPSQTKFQFWYGGGTLELADVRMTHAGDPTVGRWLTGLYLDQPAEWDDPYRSFRW